MANVDELQELRELGPDASLDDATLSALVDQLGVSGALAHLWARRASETASLVDVTESGSSRKLSGIHSQALGLAARYKALADEEAAVSTPTNIARTGLITR
jgi:hypothetical protein